jgi:hypothetical protein
MIQGLILGLSSGGICLLYCLPVLFPFLLSEGEKTRINYLYLAEFMAGRLAGYILFSVAAWFYGQILLKDPVVRETVFALSYILLSVFFGIYLLSKSDHACGLRFTGRFFTRFSSAGRITAPVMGFFTGLNLCPPFLLAFSDAAQKPGVVDSITYFVFFFVGTSVYFLPLPLAGIFRSKKIQVIGKMTALAVAVMFFIKGFLMLGGVLII